MTNAAPGSDIPRPAGLVLAPLRGLRYDPAMVQLERVLAPPYDVIDPDLRERLATRDPHNVVSVTLPEGSPEDRYAAAAATLSRWRAEGVLKVDESPSLYVYEQATADHAQRGLIGALGLTPAEDGIVLPHENTMAGPVADRLALTEATGANLEPIFLVYDGGGEATRVVAGVDATPPVADTSDPEGVRHRLWRLDDAEVLAAVAADLAPRRAVIADGHHRYATYLRHQHDRHAAGAGNGPWDRGLAFLVDTGTFGPQVQAIHRVVPGLPAARAAELAAGAFTVTPIGLAAAGRALSAAARDGAAFTLTDGERAWLLTDPTQSALQEALPVDRSAAWRSLHVSVAHHLLFRKLWQLDDREGVVDYAHDEPSAVQAARASGGVAVLLAPTPVGAVAAVAAAGDRMPRKSTLFLPKPATGMVLRAFADQPDAEPVGAVS